jgi:uncharacterized coiled-coil DUF342 family protein
MEIKNLLTNDLQQFLVNLPKNETQEFYITSIVSFVDEKTRIRDLKNLINIDTEDVQYMGISHEIITELKVENERLKNENTFLLTTINELEKEISEIDQELYTERLKNKTIQKKIDGLLNNLVLVSNSKNLNNINQTDSINLDIGKAHKKINQQESKHIDTTSVPFTTDESINEKPFIENATLPITNSSFKHTIHKPESNILFFLKFIMIVAIGIILMLDCRTKK